MRTIRWELTHIAAGTLAESAPNKRIRINTMDYWRECIESAFEEAGITATEEQIKEIAEAVDGAHECYGMAHGHDAIPNPVESQAQQELDKIRQKQERRDRWMDDSDPCKSCCTTGIARDGWGRDQTCMECNGAGRVGKNYSMMSFR